MSGSPAVTVAPEELERWRADTPGTRERVHLNNAGAALPPKVVTEVMVRHLGREAEIGGYEAAEEAQPAVEAAYAAVAQLAGCSAHNIAIVDNATVAFSLALSAFDFRPGDRLVTSRSDYTSNQIMYLALGQRRGVDVRHAADLPGGGVDPDSLRALAADPRCKVVALTWVPTNSGLVQDAEAVGEICTALGRPFLLDACQAAGQLPIDVSRLGCDFLAATARKFLRGPRGVGFLYVGDRALSRGFYPLGVDMRGARWAGDGGFELEPGARRFENWEFAYALVLGLGAAARYASEVGVARGGALAAALAAALRDRLAAIDGVTVHDQGARVCAIISAAIRGVAGRAVVERLRDARINVSAAVAGRGPTSSPSSGPQLVRLSPHYYNTADEIELAAAAIAELAAG